MSIDKYAIMLKPSILSGWMWFISLENDGDESDMVATGTAKIYTDAAEQAFQTMQELKKRVQP